MEEYRPNNWITGKYDTSCAAKCKNGTFVGKNNEGIVAFRGIPFAAPPVGKLRWKNPEPAGESDEVFEAFYNAPSAIQTELDSERASFYKQSEDCLYLNVWTAEKYSRKKRAVMVFIHGGNYGWGGTVDPLYDGHNFVKAHPDIVLVTIAYRIGVTGFIDFSEVPGGEEYATSGNLGLLDQIQALKYIQENIHSFGGNPKNVTIFGESAGGGSVSLLPLMPEAKGLFSRVIAESGSIALTYSRKEALPLTRDFLKVTGAEDMADLLALSEDELIAANEKLDCNNNFPERDGVVLPVDLFKAYAEGGAQDVDMLIGTNADELRYWILDMGGMPQYIAAGNFMYGSLHSKMSSVDRKRVGSFLRMQEKKGVKGRLWQLTELFNELQFRLPAVWQAEAHAAHGNRSYVYYWTYPSSLPDLGACHAVELAYVFNNLTETIYTGEGINEELAAKVQQMWVNFAKTGDPSTEEATWEPYSASSRNVMILGDSVHPEKDWREDERKCLLPLLKYRFNMNAGAPQIDPKPILKAAAIAAGIGGLIWLICRLLRDDD